MIVIYCPYLWVAPPHLKWCLFRCFRFLMASDLPILKKILLVLLYNIKNLLLNLKVWRFTPIFFVTVLLMYMVWHRIPASFFCMWKSRWPRIIYWRDRFLLNEWPGSSHQESGGHGYMGLGVDSQFLHCTTCLPMSVPHSLIVVSLCEVLKSGSVSPVIICYRLTPTE